MNSEIRHLFTVLDPPPGGAERFAARLDAETSVPPFVRRRYGLTAAAACAALALVVAILWLREPNEAGPPSVADSPPAAIDVYNAPELDRLLGRPLQTTELTVMLDAETLPVTRLDTANEKIRIYRIDEPASAAPP